MSGSPPEESQAAQRAEHGRPPQPLRSQFTTRQIFLLTGFFAVLFAWMAMADFDVAETLLAFLCPAAAAVAAIGLVSLGWAMAGNPESRLRFRFRNLRDWEQTWMPCPRCDRIYYRGLPRCPRCGFSTEEIKP